MGEIRKRRIRAIKFCDDAYQAHGRGSYGLYAEIGIRVRYLHSDIDTLERTEIIRDMRLNVFDVLVGLISSGKA